MRSIGAAYPSRVPRVDLAAVEALRDAAGIAVPERTVVVVGTNGKTSTAHYLGRLLAAQGMRAGVSTSPHLRRWGERAQVAGESVSDGDLAGQAAELHELASTLPAVGGLRFFDLVTLAAARIFEREGVQAAVFEAGIGGRLDATRVLRPPVVALSGVGLDHTELLGDTEEAILREKLGVAPPGARVVASALPDELAAVARRLAVAGRFTLELVPPVESWRRRNAALAQAVLGVSAGPDSPDGPLLDLNVQGRLEHRVVDGVAVLLDAAHNPQGWAALAGELTEPFVAVVSIGADRAPDGLRLALARSVAVFATTAWVGRSLPSAELARALGAEAVDDPGVATQLGLERARVSGLPLVVFGSTYLLTHAYEALGL